MAMFITVRFSKQDAATPDNAEDLFEVFNPDCYVSQLLKSIRRRCNCEIYDELVLADESCNLIPITQLAANDGLQNACSLFKERNSYILLSVSKVGRGKLVYKPLLATQYIDEELDERLKALSNPDAVDTRKSGRYSSLQKKRSKTKLPAKTTK